MVKHGCGCWDIHCMYIIYVYVNITYICIYIYVYIFHIYIIFILYMYTYNYIYAYRYTYIHNFRVFSPPGNTEKKQAVAGLPLRMPTACISPVWDGRGCKTKTTCGNIHQNFRFGGHENGTQEGYVFFGCKKPSKVSDLFWKQLIWTPLTNHRFPTSPSQTYLPTDIVSGRVRVKCVYLTPRKDIAPKPFCKECV